MLLVLLFFMPALASCCDCAPLASCIALQNGSWDCVCPFFGDGHVFCEEQRFVTDVVVRTRHNLSQWLQYLAVARVPHMTQRSQLSETQYVLELDSTDYGSMLQLTNQVNRRAWPHRVALLGAATSRVVSSVDFQPRAPRLAVKNVQYVGAQWRVELDAGPGFLSVAAGLVPLPCVHGSGSCCTLDYVYSPFKVGLSDMDDLVNCRVPVTQKPQTLGSLTTRLASTISDENGTTLIEIWDQELQAMASPKQHSFAMSINLLDEGAAQVLLSLRRNGTWAANYFSTKPQPFATAQLEQAGSRFYLRCWVQGALTKDLQVASVHYAYDDVDWVQSACVPEAAQCHEVPTPCKAYAPQRLHHEVGVLEVWVPLHNRSHGNISLHLVLQQNETLTRVQVQARPEVQARHCLQASAEAQVQVLQGLSMREIYWGPAKPHILLDTEPQTDSLVTVVRRGGSNASISELRAIHASTEAERQLLEQGRDCLTCVSEQLVLRGKALSRRSCFLFGSGDPAAWIQQYLGLQGSALALSVLAKLPSDTQGAAWIYPMWPHSGEVLATYIKVEYGHEALPARYMMFWTASQGRLRAQWLMVAAVAILILLWHWYQSI